MGVGCGRQSHPRVEGTRPPLPASLYVRLNYEEATATVLLKTSENIYRNNNVLIHKIIFLVLLMLLLLLLLLILLLLLLHILLLILLLFTSE